MEIGEQRKHERLEIARQAPGKFRLLTPAGAYPIAAIRDLSGSGIDKKALPTPRRDCSRRLGRGP